MGIGPITLVVLQPTPFCNLDCSYCYLPHRHDRRAMSDETLDYIAQRILGSPLAAPQVTIIWHAGEPMTLRPNWYRDAFSRLAAGARHRRIEHCFQTNAIGVDDHWIRLWKDWNVRIGVSLDGPADLHDRHRRTKGGRGSFALTMKGVERLQSAGVPFHVITVLSAESLADPSRLLDFYLGHGLRNISFNIDEEEGVHTRSSMRGAATENAFRNFIEHIAVRTSEMAEPFFCREIDGVAQLAGASREARRHNPQVNPLEIVTVGVDGTLSTFSPELLGMPATRFNNFAFGNVHEDGPESMLSHPAFVQASGEIAAGVRACQAACTYYDVCGGGAPTNKFFELGSFAGTETLFCRLTRKATIDVVLGVMEAHVSA